MVCLLYSSLKSASKVSELTVPDVEKQGTYACLHAPFILFHFMCLFIFARYKRWKKNQEITWRVKPIQIIPIYFQNLLAFESKKHDIACSQFNWRRRKNQSLLMTAIFFSFSMSRLVRLMPFSLAVVFYCM